MGGLVPQPICLGLIYADNYDYYCSSFYMQQIQSGIKYDNNGPGKSFQWPNIISHINASHYM